MDNIDMLFIRACRSNNPKIRLVSLQKRFWIYESKIMTDYIINSVLSEIVDKYTDIGVDKFFQRCCDDTFEYDNNGKIIKRKVTIREALIKIIRFAEVTCFPGFKPPVMFKKRDSNGKVINEE